MAFFNVKIKKIYYYFNDLNFVVCHRAISVSDVTVGTKTRHIFQDMDEKGFYPFKFLSFFTFFFILIPLTQGCSQKNLLGVAEL